MKAILVIDMPESCEECPFCDDFYYCIPEKAKGYVAFTEKSGRQEWCPLKPIPQKKTEEGERKKYPFNDDLFWDLYIQGWNECLDEITGETE